MKACLRRATAPDQSVTRQFVSTMDAGIKPLSEPKGERHRFIDNFGVGHDFSRIPVHRPPIQRVTAEETATQGAAPLYSTPAFPVGFLKERGPASDTQLTKTSSGAVENREGVDAPDPLGGVANTNEKALAATQSEVIPKVDIALTKLEAIRSNRKRGSKTTFAVPTIEGDAVADVEAGVWRFHVKAIHCAASMQIVYYTAEHYPAPTPADDTGLLTNVTQQNWQAIDSELTKNAGKRFEFWASYRAEDVHEQYHVDDYTKEMTNAFNDVAVKVGALAIDSGKPQGVADKRLRGMAKFIIEDAHDEIETGMRSRGDEPGDPPFLAEVTAVTNLVARIRAFAKSNGW